MKAMRMKPLIALLLALLISGPAFADLQVTFLDVGQGDAAIVTCDGESMVIDGGLPGSSALMYARCRELSNIRYIVATHPHDDHIGGLPAVLNAAPVELILSPVTEWDTNAFNDLSYYASEQGTPIVVPGERDQLPLGEATVTILHCWTEAWATNDMSICLRIDYGETSFLFTGDAEWTSEYMMLDSGMQLGATVLKVGHHGSLTSSTLEFLEAVHPDWAIISCGEDNEYGHPAQETLDALSAVGASVLRTDLSGTISVTSDGERLSWATFHVDPELILFVGNRNSRKFHKANCPSVAKMAEGNKVFFVRREDAVNAGYEGCMFCRP